METFLPAALLTARITTSAKTADARDLNHSGIFKRPLLRQAGPEIQDCFDDAGSLPPQTLKIRSAAEDRNDLDGEQDEPDPESPYDRALA